MPLQKQNVSLSFSGGLQQKTDAFQLQPNNMLLLENARFIKSGQVNKRPGFTDLPTQVADGTNISTAVSINTFNDELLLFDGSNIFSYLEGSSAWINRGPAVSVINSSQEVIHTVSAEQLNPDGVYSNGINLFTWQDSRGGVRYSVKDAITGAFAIQDKIIFNFAPSLNQITLRPKTIVDGYGKVNIYYTDGGTALLTNQVDPARPTILGPTSKILTDGYSGTNLIYDATVLNGNVIFAYNSLGANNYVSLKLTTGVINVAQIDILADGYSSLHCINVMVDSVDHVWVSYATKHRNGIFSQYNVYTSVFDQLGNVILAPTIVYGDPTVSFQEVITIVAVETKDPGSAYIVFEVVDSPDHHFDVALVQTNGTIQQLYVQLGLGLSSKGFSYNNNQYINVTSASALQATYFTYCLNKQTVVGKINPLVGGGYRTNNMLAECEETADPSSFLFACGQAGRFQVNNNVAFTLIGVSAETINFKHYNSFNAGTFNNNFLFVGGFLQSYDGVNVSEQNFHFFPEGVLGAPIGSGGLLSAGQYQYKVTYEWTDNYGQTNYSAPNYCS